MLSAAKYLDAQGARSFAHAQDDNEGGVQKVNTLSELSDKPERADESAPTDVGVICSSGYMVPTEIEAHVFIGNIDPNGAEIHVLNSMFSPGRDIGTLVSCH